MTGLETKNDRKGNEKEQKRKREMTANETKKDRKGTKKAEK